MQAKTPKPNPNPNYNRSMLADEAILQQPLPDIWATPPVKRGAALIPTPGPVETPVVTSSKNDTTAPLVTTDVGPTPTTGPRTGDRDPDAPAAAGTTVTNSSPFSEPSGTPASAEYPTVVPGKVYTQEELVAFQQAMSAADMAAMQERQQTMYRAGKYSDTPSGAGWVSIPLASGGYYEYRAEPVWQGYWSTSPNAGSNTGASGAGTAGATGAGSGGASQVGSSGGNDLTSLLEEWKSAAAEQANGQIDYAVFQAITELERALEDAQPAFREAAEAVSQEEAQALDNSALYAELRGDKGGIGQSQYNEIQAAAAQNRLAVQQAQTKLATDTARQIADLRAQGEFEKADKMLEITQTYLSQLISLEQWAAEFGFSQQQFQASLNQWQAEYDLAMKEFDFNTTQTQSNKYADIGSALLSAGIMPDAKQLAAMGMTEAQAKQYLTQLQLEKALGDQTGGGFRMPSTNAELYQMLKEAGATNANEAKTQLALWGVSSPGNYVGGFEDWLKRNSDEGNDQALAKYMDNPAVRTAKAYIDAGRWTQEDLLNAIEAAVGHTINDAEAHALLDYAGL